jgi:hypothetical protein
LFPLFPAKHASAQSESQAFQSVTLLLALSECVQTLAHADGLFHRMIEDDSRKLGKGERSSNRSVAQLNRGERLEQPKMINSFAVNLC